MEKLSTLAFHCYSVFNFKFAIKPIELRGGFFKNHLESP